MYTAIQYGKHIERTKYVIKLMNIGKEKSQHDVIKSYPQSGDKQTISLEEYNKELDDSEAEIERGEFYTHDQVVEISKRWVN